MLTRRKIRRLKVYKIDRLARSLIDLLSILEKNRSQVRRSKASRSLSTVLKPGHSSLRERVSPVLSAAEARWKKHWSLIEWAL